MKTATPKITIVTELHEGIYKSDRDRINGVRAIYPATVKGMRAAASRLVGIRAEMRDCYGSIGRGRTWLEIGGERPTEAQLRELDAPSALFEELRYGDEGGVSDD